MNNFGIDSQWRNEHFFIVIFHFSKEKATTNMNAQKQKTIFQKKTDSRKKNNSFWKENL
jgi:hypothetical protein